MQPDAARKGSVSAMILDTEGNPVPGGSLALLQVAEAVYEEGNNRFVFKEAFADCGLDLEEIGLEGSGAPDLAGKLALWAEDKGIEGPVLDIDEEGRACFGDLPLGLYLLIQKETADGFEGIHPFLVTVPLWTDRS